MSSPLVIGGCIALKSKIHGKYLRYSPDNGKILEVSGEDVLSPLTRFYAEPSKQHDGHFHIRCCYNNKYWVARQVRDDEWYLTGDANEAQEDLSHPSCTLLRHEPCSKNDDDTNITGGSLQHARLKRSVYTLADAHPTEKALRAGSLLLGKTENLEGNVFTFNLINLQVQKVLPKHVCFKGDNGKYLRTAPKFGFIWRGPYKMPIEKHYNYLEFSSDDSDPTVRNIIVPNSDGTIRIYSCHYGRFWRRSPNWIWGDSSDTDSSNPDTVFRVVLLGDGGKCALQNLGNNNYCVRLSTEGKKNCLNAASSTITREAELELHETVLSRKIYGVEYRLKDVNIHDLKPRIYQSKTVTNSTDQLYKTKITVSYKVATERRWDSSVSLKLGVNTTIEAGVPILTEGKVDMSAEFNASYTWGSTISNENEYSHEEEVEVPPNSQVTVRVVVMDGICDIPFSYHQEDTLFSGEKVVTKMDDGIYSLVGSHDIKVDTSNSHT